MIEEAFWSDVCNRYGLGSLTERPQSVTGGLLHRMYRLSTSQGYFAVKVLNPDIMKKPKVRNEYRRSEHIASTVAEAGIPAITAIAVEGDTVQDFGASSVMLYPWVEGKMLSPNPASADQARQIGTILGRMHALDLQIPGLPTPEFHIYPDAHWATLVQQAEAASTMWTHDPESLLADLYAWNRLARQGYDDVESHWVVSHGDLDQKNVLWQHDNTPWLVDWESVGLTHPALEAVGAALNWSGQTVEPPLKAAFTALLEGYRTQAELASDVGYAALQGCLGNWLHWLEPNMRRSLPDGSADPQEKMLAAREVVQTLTLLRSLASNLSTWAEWCGRF